MLEGDGEAFTGGEDGWEGEGDAALFFGECAEWGGVEFLEGFLGSGYEVVGELEGVFHCLG